MDPPGGKVPLVFFLALGLMHPHLLASQEKSTDRVHLKSPAQGTSRSLYVGQVLDFDAENLVIRIADDRELKLDAGRVLRIETPYLPSHTRAEQLYRIHDFKGALPEYRRALETEKRPWVRSELSAKIVLALRAQNRQQEACQLFLDHFRQRPQTRFLHVAPINWRSVGLSRGEVSFFENLIQDGNPLEQLICSSWLLEGDLSREAVRRLQQLSELKAANQLVGRINRLAQLQLWRTRLSDLQNQEPLELANLISGMRSEDRAGGFFLLASAYRQLGQSDQAILQFMKIPILFPDRYQLSAEALDQAASLLRENNRSREHLLVLRELARDYTTTAAGKAAAKALSSQHP